MSKCQCADNDEHIVCAAAKQQMYTDFISFSFRTHEILFSRIRKIDIVYVTLMYNSDCSLGIVEAVVQIQKLINCLHLRFDTDVRAHT